MEYLYVFSSNAGKYWKNADQNNSLNTDTFYGLLFTLWSMKSYIFLKVYILEDLLILNGLY